MTTQQQNLPRAQAALLSLITIDNARKYALSSEQYLFVDELIAQQNITATPELVEFVEDGFEELLDNKAPALSYLQRTGELCLDWWASPFANGQIKASVKNSLPEHSVKPIVYGDTLADAEQQLQNVLDSLYPQYTVTLCEMTWR